MNNNDLNNQYNNGINNQPVNNNQSNLTNNNTPINENSPKKSNKLFSIIIGIIVVVIVVIIIIKLMGTGKNNTGLTGYSGSNVNYTCTYKDSKDGKNLTIYSDFVFNHVEPEGTHYQLKIYNKKTIEFENGLTNSEFEKYVKETFSSHCYDDQCTGNHIELGITNHGWDTVIDKNGNKIEITSYDIYGLNQTATKEDMNKMKEQYENDGYTCK